VISSGQVFCVPSITNGLGMSAAEWRAKILDSRALRIEVDKFGNPSVYRYVVWLGEEKFLPDFIVDQIGWRDLDIKFKWISKYNSLAQDAITNFWGFKNSNVFL